MQGKNWDQEDQKKYTMKIMGKNYQNPSEMEVKKIELDLVD